MTKINKELYIGAFTPELNSWSAFLLEDFLSIAPNILERGESDGVVRDLGEVVSLEHKTPFGKYMIETSSGEKIPLGIYIKSRVEIAFELPLPYTVSRDLFDNARRYNIHLPVLVRADW